MKPAASLRDLKKEKKKNKLASRNNMKVKGEISSKKLPKNHHKTSTIMSVEFIPNQDANFQPPDMTTQQVLFEYEKMCRELGLKKEIVENEMKMKSLEQKYMEIKNFAKQKEDTSLEKAFEIIEKFIQSNYDVDILKKITILLKTSTFFVFFIVNGFCFLQIFCCFKKVQSNGWKNLSKTMESK